MLKLPLYAVMISCIEMKAFYKIKLIHFQATCWIDYDKLSFVDIY